MSIKLDKQALEKIKNYRYQTHGLTFIEINSFEHFWNFVLKLLPEVKQIISEMLIDIGTKHDDTMRTYFPNIAFLIFDTL